MAIIAAVIKIFKKLPTSETLAKGRNWRSQMTLDERLKLVNDYWKNRKSFSSKINNQIGHAMLTTFAKTLAGSTEFKGLENLNNLPIGGAIVTANHFNRLILYQLNY